jgi:ABC-type amino acid transport substrate-binding protein
MRLSAFQGICIASIFISTNVLASPFIHFKKPNTLSVCSYSEFQPVSYGNGLGYEADLIRSIAKQWHVKVQFYPQKIYEGIWLLPLNPKYTCDIAIGGITPAAYRIKQGARFTISTLSFDQSLLVRKKDYDSGRITSYHSFKHTPMKIGVVPGTTGEKYALMRVKANGLPMTTLVQYKSESELLPALKNRKIDAIARGAIGNDYQACKNPGFITIARKNFDEGFAISVDPANKNLLHLLNNEIQSIKNQKI